MQITVTSINVNAHKNEVAVVARGIPCARVEFILFIHWGSLAVLLVGVVLGLC